MTKCAVGPCDAERVDGYMYCPRHGDKPAPIPAGVCAMANCTSARAPGKLFCVFHVGAQTPRQASAIEPQAAAPVLPRGEAAIVCPHCQVRGKVHRTAAKQKRGISGGKATGAVLTAGISLLGTGLSRKVKGVQFDCGNCGTSWFVA